jgi:Nucleotidyl transferase AbiEii toxin, Type IV TA system
MKLDDFAMLEPQERQPYFAVAAERLSFSSTAVVEKDFWVCWLLQKLFALDDEVGPLTFKGGTSLSKCYGLIARFSEDIDIDVERKTIGYTDDGYFYETLSNAKRTQRVQEHNAKAYEWLHQRITPRLREFMSKTLHSSDWSLFPDERAPERLYFRYPSQGDQNVLRYLIPEIMLEFGTLDAWPTEKVAITPYVGKINETQSFEISSVRALDPL